MDEENKSKVDELSDSLYSRTRYQNPSDVRSTIRDRSTKDVEEKWHSPELNEMLTHERISPPLNPFMKKFFVFGILFFLATVFVAAFVFLGGSNFISSKNLDINIVGPTSTSAGSVIELGVTIDNNNNTDLEVANLSVQYPEDTRDPQDSSRGLTFNKYDLGVVKAGGQATRPVRMILLGSAGEVKDVKFSVEYKVRGSNAIFYKDKIYQVTIGEAPLSLNVQSPAKVSSGETFTTEVLVKLNSTETLKNVMLRAEYPYGYSAENSSPPAVSDDNVWALGDLSPGASKKVQIRGRLVGENQDERTFRFYVGVSEGATLNPNFKTVLVSSQKTIAIERPFISLNVTFNGEGGTSYVAPAGQNISTSIRLQNNLPEKLLNPKLEVRLSGSVLNGASIAPQNGGVYNAVIRRINWNILNSVGVSEFSPGDSGTIGFSFASIQDASSVVNKDITLQFTFSGIGAADNKPITITETKTVKIGAQVSLSARALHSMGPFNNTGAIPPKVGTETTYAILLSVGNTSSDLNDAKVTARLGTNVKWKSVYSAGSENVTYNESTNTITWNLGGLSSGSGFSTPPREVAFQISLTPTTAQVGSAPTLVSGIVFSAFDTSLSKAITVSASPLTTRISTDPAFIQGDDVVQK
ncbi:MAG: hypothetical protein AAB758_02615 [Patescibacteria group bacterium]